MRYFRHILASVFVLTLLLALFAGSDEPVTAPQDNLAADVSAPAYAPDSRVDYSEVDRQLAELRRLHSQPNILKDDILRGYYLASYEEKKYGTPDTWVFVEDGVNSKWISTNVLDEEDRFDNQYLCKSTAGTFVASCLDSTDLECEYVAESYCSCIEGSKWKEGQGCILTTIRGSYVAINAQELQDGYYLGLPNEKKLNTPEDWIWVEEGRQSKWRKN